MIFGRKKKATTDPGTDETTDAREVSDAVATDPAGDPDDIDEDTLAPDTPDEPDATDEADETDGDADTDDADTDDAEDWAALDQEKDWRDDGPFDIDEVDLDADDVERLDLGALIVTPAEGMELRLQVSEETQQVMSAMVLLGESALELTVFAAPRSGGMWADIRPEIIQATEQIGGTATLARGPFGTELRRLLTVRTEDGQEGYQPSRTWAVEGPRWLLRGIVYGQASMVEGTEAPADELHDVFCNLIVRRGDDARAPGDVVPLTLPEGVGEN